MKSHVNFPLDTRFNKCTHFNHCDGENIVYIIFVSDYKEFVKVLLTQDSFAGTGASSLLRCARVRSQDLCGTILFSSLVTCRLRQAHLAPEQTVGEDEV
jgi:hypothetical protein